MRVVCTRRKGSPLKHLSCQLGDTEVWLVVSLHHYIINTYIYSSAVCRSIIDLSEVLCYLQRHVISHVRLHKRLGEMSEKGNIYARNRSRQSRDALYNQGCVPRCYLSKVDLGANHQGDSDRATRADRAQTLSKDPYMP